MAARRWVGPGLRSARAALTFMLGLTALRPAASPLLNMNRLGKAARRVSAIIFFCTEASRRSFYNQTALKPASGLKTENAFKTAL